MSMFQFIPKEGLYLDMEIISEFDVRVVNIITTLTFDEMDTKHSISHMSYEIVSITQDGEELPAKHVTSLNNLDYFSLWSQIIDADLTSRQRKLLKMRLQQSVRNAKNKQILCAANSGIYKITEASLIYISGDQIITHNIISHFSISLKNNLIRMGTWSRDADYPFETSMLLKRFMDVAPGTSEIIFLSVLLGVIKPFFIEAGINPSFCINLYGDSGTHKTSLVKAMCFLGQREDLFVGSIINDLKSKVLKAIDAAYGRVYLLDDYHPGVSKQKKERQTDLIDAVVRHIEANSHTAFVIITSEFLDGCYSTQDRMFQIHITNVDLHLLSEIQTHRSYLPTIAYELVQQLLTHLVEVQSDIKNWYQELENMQNSDTRTIRHGITLKVVARLAQKYLYNAESNKMNLQKLDDAIDKQIRIQNEHMKHLRQLESNQDIIQVLYQILNDNTFQICSDCDGSYKAKFNQIFLKDTNFIYISKPALHYGLRQYFNREFSSLRKIIDILSEEGILSEDTDAKTKKIFGVRHVCISIYALEQYMNSISHISDIDN